ncbi:hypothetical protein GF407_17790 [candidate division KSB1 bacterium]|nr:hypothetical protein [candidate division KSB1 bacterium]
MIKRLLPLTVISVLLMACSPKQNQPKPAHSIYHPPHSAEIAHQYQTRCDSLIDYYASLQNNTYFHIAANLYLRKNLETTFAKLDTLLQNPGGDMFWMYPFVMVSFLGQDLFPPNIRTKMRTLWKTYTPFRGDTENHWAMYYASLYLITQMYPNDPGNTWFNGKTSRENHREAEEYLIHWIELTTSLGQGEFDSPDYYGCFMAPVALLSAFAKDAAMQKRAAMLLDYLVADFAAENLGGFYVGGHSRIYPRQVRNGWETTATAFSWLLFGNTLFRPSGQSLFLAISGYQPPEILYHIANDRSEAYVHKEYKRTRHRMRYSEQRNAPVYKYNYICNDYALGSIQGGLLQPIQQHTWDITWSSDTPRQGYNTLFTLHPYSSADELKMYFTYETDLIVDAIVKSKTTYDSPEKLTGGSPYERAFQHRKSLIVLYDIPPQTRFPHINGFFPKSLSRRETDDSGWIFCQGGQALIAFYPLAPYEWIEKDGYWRYFSSELHNGAVVQTAAQKEFASFEDFKQAVRKLRIITNTSPKPSVLFTTLDQEDLAFTFGEIPSVNGVAVDYNNWKLFDSPFLQATRKSQRMEMHYKELHKILDFNSLTTKTWIN